MQGQFTDWMDTAEDFERYLHQNGYRFRDANEIDELVDRNVKFSVEGRFHYWKEPVDA